MLVFRSVFISDCWSSTGQVYLHIRFLDFLLFCFFFISFFSVVARGSSIPGCPFFVVLAPVPTRSGDHQNALIISWTIHMFNKANNAPFPSSDSWPIRPSGACGNPRLCFNPQQVVIAIGMNVRKSNTIMLTVR